MRTPPVLARVLRGERCESLHRGDVAVVDEEGSVVALAGDPLRPIYLRSAAKPFQVMPLLAASGERLFRLNSDEIAVMCASHGGEPRHVRTVASLLSRGGFGVADLGCGAHLPMHEASAFALLARGEKPTALHNNCSGKHAGLLLACRARRLDPEKYVEPDHPIEREVLDFISEFCGIPAGRIGIAIDGCSLPVFHLPLAGLARGYARLMSRHLDGEGVQARELRRRIRRAMWESPGMVAGLGRFTTDLLEAGRARWIGKEGAEGVYAIGLAPSGAKGKALGIAFKMEDGSSRARDAIALEILALLKRLTASAQRRLRAHRAPILRNVAGRKVGSIEARVDLAMR
jgi:L-asparaginase II